MAGHMHMRLPLRDDLRPKLSQLIHDAANRDFIARDDPGGEDDSVPLRKLQLMWRRRRTQP